MTAGEFDFNQVLAARHGAERPLACPADSGAARRTTIRVIISLEEMRAAINAAAASAQRLMSIYTPDLEPDLYDQNAFLDIIKHFVLARSFAKVRVLLSDSDAPDARQQPLHRHGPPALELHRHPPRRRRSPEAARLRLSDRRRSRHRLPHARRIAGTASPISTIRRSRASTSTSSTRSGTPARPTQLCAPARIAEHG